MATKADARKFLYLLLLSFWVLFAVVVMDTKTKPQRHPTSLSSPMTVSITPVDGIPNHDAQELVLRADVVLNTEVDGDVEWSWNLPPEASIVSGEANDVWPGMRAGERAHAEISVLNVSKDSMKTVTFTVKALSGKRPIQEEAAFVTKANSSLERSALRR
jgi:hypothetical protein